MDATKTTSRAAPLTTADWDAYWDRYERIRTISAACDHLTSARVQVYGEGEWIGRATRCFYAYLAAKHSLGREITAADWAARTALEYATDATGRLAAADALERCSVL